MKNKKETSLEAGQGVRLTSIFTAWWIVNGVVLFLANRFFGSQVVLGSRSISKLGAIIVSMGVLAWIDFLAMFLVKDWEAKENRELVRGEWAMLYWAVNFWGVWLLGRGAEYFGMGISSWLVAAIMGLVLTLVQGWTMLRIEQLR